MLRKIFFTILLLSSQIHPFCRSSKPVIPDTSTLFGDYLHTLTPGDSKKLTELHNQLVRVAKECNDWLTDDLAFSSTIYLCGDQLMELCRLEQEINKIHNNLNASKKKGKKRTRVIDQFCKKFNPHPIDPEIGRQITIQQVIALLAQKKPSEERKTPILHGRRATSESKKQSGTPVVTPIATDRVVLHGRRKTGEK
jgi:ATP-dependent Clp protease ATP-binding subunit ClpA